LLSLAKKNENKKFPLKSISAFNPPIQKETALRQFLGKKVAYPWQTDLSPLKVSFYFLKKQDNSQEIALPSVNLTHGFHCHTVTHKFYTTYA